MQGYAERRKRPAPPVLEVRSAMLNQLADVFALPRFAALGVVALQGQLALEPGRFSTTTAKVIGVSLRHPARRLARPQGAGQKG